MICCVFCELINVQSCCVATVIVRDLLSMCNIKPRVYTFEKLLYKISLMQVIGLLIDAIISNNLIGIFVPRTLKIQCVQDAHMNLKHALLCRYDMHVYSSEKYNLLTFALNDILAAFS